MSYDFSTQHAQGTPNFPDEPAPERDVAWGTDILADPADNDNVHDPATGWGKGAGVRSS